MLKRKKVLFLYLISAFVFIFSAQAVFAEDLTPAKKTAVAWVDGAKGNFEEIAKYIWENPELSLVEFKSSGKLQEYLEKNGFKIEKGVAGIPTGFVATWGSGKPVIGFLAEFDALPNLSQKSAELTKAEIVPGGPGHGCGHNLIPIAHEGAGYSVGSWARVSAIQSQPTRRWRRTGSAASASSSRSTAATFSARVA